MLSDGPPSVASAALESCIPTASSTLAATQAGADEAHLSRLHSNAQNAVLHITEAVDTLVSAVQQYVPEFVFQTRAHCSAVDKLLEAKEDELCDTIKIYEAYLQQSSSGGDTADSAASIVAMQLASTDPLPNYSNVLDVSVSTSIFDRMGEASHVQAKVDPCLTVVSHPHWMERGGVSSVHIAVADPFDEAVCNLTSQDVSVTFEGAADGWSVATTSLDGTAVSLEVVLSCDCSVAATMNANIGSASIIIPLQVSFLL